MSNAYSNVLHQSNAQNNFEDKSIISTWAENAVNKLVTNGILVGYPDGTFKGSKEITRAEGITMIMKILRNYAQTIVKWQQLENRFGREMTFSLLFYFSTEIGEACGNFGRTIG